MTALTLRVVWPITDVLMSDTDAIHEAWIDLPTFAERFQVAVTDRPRMQVVVLTPDQRQAFNASRAVVCHAPVIHRADIPGRVLQAA